MPVIWYGKETEAMYRRASVRALRKGGDLAKRLIQNAISKSARGPGRGARSFSAKTKRKPMAIIRSKPGEPPRADTGGLRRSIFASVDKTRVEAKVGTTLKYGAYLEKGTRGGRTITPKRKKVLVFPFKGKWVFASKVIQGAIKPRPFIAVTVNRYWPMIFAAMTRELKSGEAMGLVSKLQVRSTDK